ncbi:hypothetical protein HK097_008400 [Rhizophlyctis rosea]|uniref:Uncharacterized protein n=1 Tax=Rhizophlyctis rosea TaxID=64517 RepID=A0AAD5SDH8_9FUNG|nr:hypothetical protein HK097_008400 [Rhizophlyctis rosea]
MSSFNKILIREVIESAKERPQIYYTPRAALECIGSWVPAGLRIWEPACGQGHIAGFFKERGHDVVATDLDTGSDFLTCVPPEYDILITNPPFKLRKQFLQRAHKLGRPYMLLLPLNTLDRVFYREWAKGKDVRIFCPRKKIDYIRPDGKKSNCLFYSAWFTHDVAGIDMLHFE